MDSSKEQLKKLLGINESKISVPPNPSMGDYSTTIAFDKAKGTGENPTITAIKIISELDLSSTNFSTVKAYGPYINFFLDKDKLFSNVLKRVLKEGEAFSSTKLPKREVIVVEFPSPNTNKPLHLGHLKNMSLGLSVSRILESLGFTVKRVNLFNDRGVHICKSMLAYQKWGKSKTPKKKPDFFVGDYYVMFSKKAEDDKKLDDEVQEMLRAWEAGDKKVLSLWKKMNNWFYKGVNETFKRFGLDKYVKVYYESEFYTQGMNIIAEGLKNKVFEKENNAVYADLGALGKKYLVREDGTALYIVQDLALANLKFKDFKFDKSVHVVGNEQKQYLQQLFKIFELLKYPFAGKSCHLSHGMVGLPTGKMKSREGAVVEADDLMNEMQKLAGEEVKKRGKKLNAKVCDLIGLSAVKYFLLNISAHKDIVFNTDESISFEGRTGPYLLYSLVRALKIVKNKKMVASIKPKFYKTGEEFKLVKDFARLGEVLNECGKDLSPHHLCAYAYDLASDFNSFYDKCPVLQAEDEDIKKARLLLVKAFINVMSKVLYLLGIESVKEM